MLNQAEAAKALAEAGKTAGPDYNKATWEAKNLEIENRIKTITEGITGANLTKAEADAQKAVAEWNSAMAKAEVDQATKKTATKRNDTIQTNQYPKKQLDNNITRIYGIIRTMKTKKNTLKQQD